MTASTKMRANVLAAALAGLSLRLLFILKFPLSWSGDTQIYDQLARNWLDHHVYGLWLYGRLVPTDMRVPGYPAFLAAVYSVFGRAPVAVMLAQATLDVVTCFVIAALAATLAPQESRRRVALAALWLAALCPFTANYTATVLTESLAIFLTALALLTLVLPVRDISLLPGNRSTSSQAFFLAGIVVGLGALVRPETPLILAAVMFVLLSRWWRMRDWSKLACAGLLLAVGLLLPLLPWAARNWRTLHKVQFLAPRYSELPGEYVPRGFNAWTETWLWRFRDVYLVPWKLDDEAILIDDLPASAFDSAEERARVAALLEQYNETTTMTAELDAPFAELARERTARRPLRTFLAVPLLRAWALWITPRIETLPFTGLLWPLGEKWEEDPVDLSFTYGFAALNFFYVGLAIAGAWLARCRPAVAFLVAFILLRTALFTQIETPEPRYVLECFPALLALAAQVWSRTR